MAETLKTSESGIKFSDFRVSSYSGKRPKRGVTVEEEPADGVEKSLNPKVDFFTGKSNHKDPDAISFDPQDSNEEAKTRKKTSNSPSSSETILMQEGGSSSTDEGNWDGKGHEVDTDAEEILCDQSLKPAEKFACNVSPCVDALWLTQNTILVANNFFTNDASLSSSQGQLKYTNN